MTDNLFVDPLPNQDMRVSTDKADYAPGETVKITASGFAKDSTIQFEIKDDPNDPGDDGEADVYKPFSITDGGAGDLDGIANGQVLAAWGVPTDNNGTGGGTPDALNATLNLTATGPDGQAATTMFMDALGLKLNQWETINAAWNNGQANPNQATYLEGDVVPYSVEVSGVSGVSTGTIYGIRINMNTYQANTDAGGFVFIDTYDKSISPLPDNFEGASPVADSTFAFSDPLYSQPAGLTFYVTNGDVLSVTYSNSASGLDRFADVTFTANAGTGSINDKTEIYWGEKLALPNEVISTANPDSLSKGAAGFTGGSLQTKIEGSPTPPGSITWITPSNAVQLQPGVVVRGLISGYKWNDTNGNSQWDTGELGLGGWTINLYKDTNNNDTYESDIDDLYSTAVTSNGSQDVNGDGVNDPLGYYEFSSAAQPNKPLLRNDKFFVLETLQSGWTQTYPTTPNGTPNSMGSNYWGPFTITTTTPQFKGVSGAGSEDPTNAVGNFGNQQFNPSIEVIKTAGSATDGATLQTLTGPVTYSYKVTNTGDVALTNVTVVDDNGTSSTTDDFTVGTIASLATRASQTLTSTRNITTDTTNIATATGTTPINGTVSDTDNAVVDVIARTGDLKITKTDYLTKVVPGQCVTYTIVVSNCGPDTATHALVEDLFPSNLTDVKWTSKAAKGATDNKARGTDNIEDYVTLPAGSSITYKVTGTVVGGHGSHKVSDCHRTLTNTATVTAPSDFTDTNLENNTATDIDTIMAAPGVRNTHFWQNTKWQKSWDGIQGNEHSQKTRPNFPDSDLLLSPYTNSARSGKVLDPITRRYGVGLLIGDYNHNGKTDKKENTLFYTRAQALQIVDSSMHPNNRDTRYILGRDLVTSWLNYLAGNSIDTPNSKDQDARDYINEGIHWLQALTPDQNRDGKGDGYLQGLTGNETSNSRTPQILARSSYWKSGISSASNLPNSYKSNTDVLYPIDAGISIHTHLDNYNNNIF